MQPVRLKFDLDVLWRSGGWPSPWVIAASTISSLLFWAAVAGLIVYAT